MSEKNRANEATSFAPGDPPASSRFKTAPLRWDNIAPFADAGFRAVFDSSAEALLVVDPAGVIQKANQRARDVLRMREANLARTSLDDFVATLSPEKLTRMGIEEAPLAPPSVEALLASGSPIRVTLRAVLPGSGHMLLCLDGVPDRERADRAEAELRASAQSAAAVFFDANGAVRFASPRFAELLGMDPATPPTFLLRAIGKPSATASVTPPPFTPPGRHSKVAKSPNAATNWRCSTHRSAY